MKPAMPDHWIAEAEWRFWAKVDKSGDCWEWTGSRSVYGYGAVNVNRRPRGAHRVSWELANGPIPPGLYILHHCDNPPCVNPDHLYAGTQRDNMADIKARGRRNPKRADHCHAGHPYDAANSYWWRGRRQCRTCNRIHNLAYYHRRKAKVAA